MNLERMSMFKRRTRSDQVTKKQKKRIQQQAQPTVQKSIKYTSQFEDGLMHIVEDEFSRTYRLGELDYDVATEEEQLNVVMGYAEGLNSLDKNSRYQLLVVNKRVPSHLLDETLLSYRGDPLDSYRQEMNTIITKQFQQDQRNFVIEKYVTFTTKSTNPKQANRNLDTMSKNFKSRFDNNDIHLSMDPLPGIERLKLMSSLLQPTAYFSTTYKEMAIAGLNSKAFVGPGRLSFPVKKDYIRLGNMYGAVLYIRHYPKYLEDKLIRELCATGHELAISIHATPYDMIEARKNIQAMQTLNNAAIEKRQRENFRSGVSEDMIAGEASEIKRSTKALMEEIKDNGQKLFSGVFTVFVIEETEEALRGALKAIHDVGLTWQVDFEGVELYKEEALNTILPIGKPYLDVEMNYMRDMTTTNVASQVPFSNIELQSSTGQFYGRNQLTHNMITIDRKKDLIAPTGLIFGTTGSGKGMTTKWEILSARLKYPKDRFIVIDPESEYLPLAKELGGEILDISTGTNHHLNILDMVDARLLDEEDRNVDLVKEKANLLTSLFESLLKTFTDEDAAMVDRVTRLTYQRFEETETTPTLVDWHEILLEQGGEVAKRLAMKTEPYTIGSQDIFAHQTNIDLSSNFIVFNSKKLDERLKKFAMKVLLDQTWKQIVLAQGKETIRLYFDELQVNFSTEEEASWFLNVWSRIRKYGGIATGITQNPSTLLDSAAGRRMISNSEFVILLRQKPLDLRRLNEIMNLSPKLTKYIGERIPQGTGLIYAGGVIVPFENPIPKNTQLYTIMNTDA